MFARQGSQALRCCLDGQQSLSYQAGNDVSGAPATAVPDALFGLLVSYRPLADEASDEDFLGPEAYEAIPRRLLHGYLAVSSSSFPKILGN